MAMRIIDLRAEDEATIQQVAALLVAAFAAHWPGSWSNQEEALAEVRKSFGADRISRVALDDDGVAVGWVGGIPAYRGHVWELHPLAVRPDRQGQGIGRALVADLADQARSRGGLTLWLGTDDVDDMTTLAGVDLFPNVVEHLARIQNRRRHPYEFYQKQGFVVVGALPDANGLGKPDIFMAKSLVR
jgi:aminoglycoside 6'-N-acetyltransferase I